jgi:hypothetical protein
MSTEPAPSIEKDSVPRESSVTEPTKRLPFLSVTTSCSAAFAINETATSAKTAKIRSDVRMIGPPLAA